VTRRAMMCYAASGNPSLALQLFKSFEAELARELGVAPSAETRELFADLCGRVPPASCPQPSIR
jgi:DNA-binding SARP family transcriptional activator